MADSMLCNIRRRVALDKHRLPSYAPNMSVGYTVARKPPE